MFSGTDSSKLVTNSQITEIGQGSILKLTKDSGRPNLHLLSNTTASWNASAKSGGIGGFSGSVI